ncbi:protein ORF75 [Cyprinid herpesvirus 1]|uniref:Protein ORF75 n=1 Tax=Cyprinid herpesvirus 1 TaxID=317858 RepID=K7PC82_9VIRU|nr:protein ORF75 [Cyprinid herpesvirus 1]AFJ20372.1 protein ORF75 [Cyprinid herpesvirus 1]
MEGCVSMLFDLLAIAKCQRLYAEEALEVVLAKINEFYSQWGSAFLEDPSSSSSSAGHFGPEYVGQLLNGGHFTPYDANPGFTEGSQLCRLTNRLLPVTDLAMVYYEPCPHKILAWEQSSSDLGHKRPYLDARVFRNCLEPELVASKLALLEGSSASNSKGAFVKRKRLGLTDPSEDRLSALNQKLRSEAGPMYVAREHAADLIMYSATSKAVLEFLTYPEVPLHRQRAAEGETC